MFSAALLWGGKHRLALLSHYFISNEALYVICRFLTMCNYTLNLDFFDPCVSIKHVFTESYD